MATYEDVRRRYVELARTLAAASPPGAGVERTRSTEFRIEELERANELERQSELLLQASAAQLDSTERTERAVASAVLLAQSTVDLEIGLALIESASDDASVRVRTAGGASIEDELRIIGETSGGSATSAPVQATGDLRVAIKDCLSVLVDTSSTVCVTAFRGVTTMGVSEIAGAMVHLGDGLAGWLGAGAVVSTAVELGRKFIRQALEALETLLGPKLTALLKDELKTWFTAWRDRNGTAVQIARLYGTTATATELAALASAFASAKSIEALRLLSGIEENFKQQAAQARKLMAGLLVAAKLAPFFPIPNFKLVIAASYASVAGYIVIAGADYADAPRPWLPDRVGGVRRSITLLSTS